MMALTACGGGGSGDPGNATPSATAMAEPQLLQAAATSVVDAQGLGLSVSTSGLDIRLTEGQAVATTLTIRSMGTREFPAGAQAQVVDSAGLLRPYSNGLEPFVARSQTADLLILSAPTAGRYTGTLTVRVCTDKYCDTHIGPQITVPYTVTVAAFPTRLTALSTLTTSTPWFTYRANNARTGHVPLTLDARRFQARWLWRGLPHPTDVGVTAQITGMAWADGSLVVSSQQYFPFVSHLTRLLEDNGSQSWDQANEGWYIGGPSVSEGRIWASRQLPTPEYKLVSWALSNGQVQTQAAFSDQHPQYFGPAITGGGIVAMGGSTGGLLRADASSGQLTWEMPFSNRAINQTTPATDAQRAYVYTPSSCSGCGEAGLHGHDLSTGQNSLYIADAVGAARWQDKAMRGSVVLSGPQSASVIAKSVDPRGPHRLLRFDLNGKALSWSQEGGYLGAPVAAHGVVYVARSDPFGVEARRESDGTLLWRWQEPAPMAALAEDDWLRRMEPAGAMALTDSHLFVSSTQRVYAIDLGAHTTAWQHPRGGDLLVSPTGVLYIAAGGAGRFAGQVVAINLQ
jgi:outer membrane protein assembly factor BamB